MTPGWLSTPDETSTAAAPEILNRLRQQLGGQPARQHPRSAPRTIRDQRPVESEAIAAGKSVAAQRRLCVEQQNIGDILVASGAEHIFEPGDRHRLHDRAAEAPLGRGNSFRAFAAMELQNVDRRRRQSGLDHPIIGVDEEADPRDPGGNAGAQPRGTLRRHGARARRIKNKAEIGGAAGARRRYRLLCRQTTNLRGYAHRPLYGAEPRVKGG